MAKPRKMTGPDGVNLSGPVIFRGFAMSGDRKSTRLNSSHGYISYAVFCLKKKTAQPVEVLRRPLVTSVGLPCPATSCCVTGSEEPVETRDRPTATEPTLRALLDETDW